MATLCKPLEFKKVVWPEYITNGVDRTDEPKRFQVRLGEREKYAIQVKKWSFGSFEEAVEFASANIGRKRWAQIQEWQLSSDRDCWLGLDYWEWER